MSAAPAHEPLLAAFRRAGVLADGDLAVAATLGRLTGERTPEVALAAALAVRAPRLGHVCVDLDAVAGHAVAEPAGAGAPAPEALPWPEPAAWRAALVASPAVAVGPAGHRTGPADGRPGPSGELGAEDAGAARPLVLDGPRLYLDRYWRYERRLAAALAERAAGPPIDVDPAAVRAAIERLLPPPQADGPDRQRLAVADGPDRQRLAVAAGATGALTVVTGGPGTGKTTVVARLLAVLLALAEDGPRLPRLALAAPTGKAAARLDESLREAVAGLGLDAGLAEALAGVRARTLHRLLGSRGPGRTRFRHDAANPLDVDAVVVDEASMVPLALMAKLVDAVPAGARLVLLGDRDQLASVEAGAVLGDVCGPQEVVEAPRSARARERLAAASGQPVPGVEADAPGIGDAIVRLTRFHRFGADSAIGRLAAAIRGLDEDPAPALAVLAEEDGREALRLRGDDAGVRAALAEAVEVYAEVAAHAAAGRATEALAGLDRCRVLCAHRRGPRSVADATSTILAALAARGVDVAEPWFPGRAVLVTENDPSTGLANGDVGVVVAVEDGARRIAFPAAAGVVRLLAPARLPAVETTYATTIHKSQGSQVDHAVVLLPAADSPIATRELVYTAVTRARERVSLLADAEVTAAALSRRIQRPSGLAAALWG